MKSIFDNEFTGDAKAGFLDALRQIYTSNQGRETSGESGSGEQDPRLHSVNKQPDSQNNQQSQQNANQQQSDSQQQNSQQQSSQQQNSQQGSQNQSQSQNQTSNSQLSKKVRKQIDQAMANSKQFAGASLSAQDKQNLVDQVEKARERAKQIQAQAENTAEQKLADGESADIEDATADVAEDSADALSELANMIADSLDVSTMSEDDAESIRAKVENIMSWADNPENSEQIRQQLSRNKQLDDFFDSMYNNSDQLRSNSKSLLDNASVETADIQEIIADIMYTLKQETSGERASSITHYNPLSKRLTQRGRSGKLAGRYIKKIENIPSILLYFDISGSWINNPLKLYMGLQVFKALQVLSKQGKISLKAIFFADTANTSASQCGGGNSAEPVPHLSKMVANDLVDNVIIITDSDPSPTTEVVVPGFAWLLFYDTINSELIASVHGELGTSAKLIAAPSAADAEAAERAQAAGELKLDRLFSD